MISIKTKSIGNYKKIIKDAVIVIIACSVNEGGDLIHWMNENINKYDDGYSTWFRLSIGVTSCMIFNIICSAEKATLIKLRWTNTDISNDL